MDQTQRDIVDVGDQPPLSKSMQPKLPKGKMIKKNNSTIKEKAQIVKDVVASMQPKLKTLQGKTNDATIFLKPHIISKSKKKLFEPTVISIGPFHHGEKDLQAFEDQKWQFLQDFLSRGDLELDLCISEMKDLEERTRRCYSQKFDNLESDAFVEMMLLDGCYVLEYFLKLYEENLNYSHVIYRDLLLLENQIPFFIVDKLYEIGSLNQKVDRMIFVKFLALIFLSRPELLTIKDPRDSIIPDPPDEIHHLVHLCYHYLVPNPDKPDVLSSKSFPLTRMLHLFRSKPECRGGSPHSTSGSSSVALGNSNGNISLMVIPTATELKKKGLEFKQKSNPKHMLDISFEHGVLQIPRLAITADNKPILANLVAFEHSKYGAKNSPFTSFVSFLDNLINTAYDVRILQGCGIVENWLGSEKEVTQFINQFTEVDISERYHYFAELYKKVNEYIESNWDQSWWRRQRAKLIREHFSSPWKAISVVAAFILLVLTCVQTFYTVYTYKFPPSS